MRGLVFEAGDALADLAAVVGDACARLTAANVPHNLFVVDCGQRLFLFPNAFALAKAQGRVPEDLLATQARPLTLALLRCSTAAMGALQAGMGALQAGALQGFWMFFKIRALTARLCLNARCGLPLPRHKSCVQL